MCRNGSGCVFDDRSDMVDNGDTVVVDDCSYVVDDGGGCAFDQNIGCFLKTTLGVVSGAFYKNFKFFYFRYK